MPVIDIQGTWQTGISDQYQRRKLWAIGNIILMGLDSVEDGWEAMHNIGNFGPTATLPIPGQYNYPVAPEHAQYTMAANWVQMFKQRECVVRRYKDQAVMDPSIIYVPKIQDIKVAESTLVEKTSDEIFKKRAVLTRDALNVVNQRELNEVKQPPPEQGRKP
jgi:hypothetical protein